MQPIYIDFRPFTKQPFLQLLLMFNKFTSQWKDGTVLRETCTRSGLLSSAKNNLKPFMAWVCIRRRYISRFDWASRPPPRTKPIRDLLADPLEFPDHHQTFRLPRSRTTMVSSSNNDVDCLFSTFFFFFFWDYDIWTEDYVSAHVNKTISLFNTMRL